MRDGRERSERVVASEEPRSRCSGSTTIRRSRPCRCKLSLRGAVTFRGFLRASGTLPRAKLLEALLGALPGRKGRSISRSLGDRAACPRAAGP